MTKTPATPLRLRLMIDREVQGMLLIRASLYAAAGLLYLLCVMYFSQTLSEPDRSWSQHLLDLSFDALHWAPGLLVLVPIVGHDILRMSNQFAGPIFRLRTEMEKLTAGQDGRPVNFRDGDHWTELSELYNQLRVELLELRAQTKLPNPNDETAVPARRPEPVTPPAVQAFDRSESAEVLASVTS